MVRTAGTAWCVPASSIPFYSPGDFCETSLRLHSIRKLLSHPRDKASQFQRLPPRLTPPPSGASSPSSYYHRCCCHTSSPPPPTPPLPRGTVFNSIYNRTAKYRSQQLLVRCRCPRLVRGATPRSGKQGYLARNLLPSHPLSLFLSPKRIAMVGNQTWEIKRSAVFCRGIQRGGFNWITSSTWRIDGRGWRYIPR